MRTPLISSLVVASLWLSSCAMPIVADSGSPRLFRVILPVSDIDRAADFYAVVLGIPGQRISPGRHYFDCGGTILACFDAKADGDPQVTTPNPEWLYFAVDDLDQTYSVCRAANATFHVEDIDGTRADEPVVRPWGERSFYVVDPFGNKVCFVARDTAFTGF